MKTFNEYSLTEMIVVGKKPQSGDYIVAFDKWIWVLSEYDDLEETFKDILNKLSRFVTIDDLESHVTDELYDFLQGIQEWGAIDVLVGKIDKNTLILLNETHFFETKTSLLIKKVVGQLNLRAVEYSDSMFMTSKKVTRKHIKGEVPDIGYHGTSSIYVNNILRIGLRPGRVDSNYKKQNIEHPELIFFTTQFNEAAHHGYHTARTKSGFPVVLEFAIPDKTKIIPDYDMEVYTGIENYYTHRSDNRWTRTYKTDAYQVSKDFGIYGYRGNILPKFIKWVWVDLVNDETELQYKKMKPSTFLKNLDYFESY